MVFRPYSAEKVDIITKSRFTRCRDFYLDDEKRSLEMELQILLIILTFISTVHLLPENTEVEESVSTNLSALETVINSHHGVFSNMVVKPLISQLEKRPSVLDRMRENDLGVKVKHESESDTVIDPQSLGLESFYGLRIKVKHKAKSEFEVEPVDPEIVPFDFTKVEIARKAKREKGPVLTYFNRPLELRVIEQERQPEFSEDISNRGIIMTSKTPYIQSGVQDTSDVKVSYIQPNNARVFKKLCYEAFGILRCNGKPMQQMWRFPKRQFIDSSDYRYNFPIHFLGTPVLHNPEVTEAQRNRLMQWQYVLPPMFSYFPLTFAKRPHYFVL